jgi:hypothetical protein
MNRNKLGLMLIISLIFIYTCSEELSVTEKIIGKWEMIKVKELSEDVTERHNPDKNRWIRFIEDRNIERGGLFESGRDNVKENSGKWFYDKNENELYLDSDAGEDDDSYWSVTVEGNTMLWKGRKFEFNKRFEIEYKKTN